MMNKLNFTSKKTGDVLNASEWNTLVSKTDEIVDAVNDGAGSGSGSGSGSVVIEGDSHVTFDGTNKHNLTIATTAADQYIKNGETKGGKINIEPISDLQIKSGDDIILCSHHRENPTEVSVKVHDGEDHPVKLQVNTADIVLTTKDKSLTKQKDENGDDTSTALYTDPNVLNVTVNSAKNTRGYLKVRAQAIDLRCEDHGGIALQPKGRDGDDNMNKIKFEHGGGDGLEFGTFNAEKTSIFTDEYRFNKSGVWKMATRHLEASDKVDPNDNTTDFKYAKNNAANNAEYAQSDAVTYEAADDFYDFINVADPTTTTENIILTSDALNGMGVKTHTTNKGNLEIQTTERYISVDPSTTPTTTLTGPFTVSTPGTPTSLSTVEGLNISRADLLAIFDPTDVDTATAALDALKNGDTIKINFQFSLDGGQTYTTLSPVVKKLAKDVNIESCADVKIEAANKLSLKGILDFGSSFQFGETDEGIEFQIKKTKKNADKRCDTIKVHAYNNHASNYQAVDTYVVDTTNHTYSAVQATIAPGQDQEVGSCNVLDLIKFVNWAKATQFGPWDVTAVVPGEPQQPVG